MKEENFYGLFDAGIDAYFADGFAQGLEEIEATVFYGAASFVVDYQGTLLGLFGGMPADFDECVDYVLECIYIVVKDDEVHEIGGLYGFEDIGCFFVLI